MKPTLGRANLRKNWKPQGLLGELRNLRLQLEDAGEINSLEMLVLNLFQNVFVRTGSPQEQDAMRVRYALARMLSHLSRHSEELPSRLQHSFDVAAKALEAEIIH